jgi:type I restriction enzyme S subunit
VIEGLVLDHYPMRNAAPPHGWATCSISSVAESVSSGFPSGLHNSEGRGVPHIRPMNIDREGRFDLTDVKSVEGDIPKLLKKGDVLFNNTNSPELIGKTTVILTDSPLAFSNHMTRIRLEGGMNPAFVARQLHYLWMAGYFRHRCKNHVNQASIASEPLAQSVPLLVPPPKEQERIADKLDELLSDLDAGVAALERVRAKLKHYRTSVLKAAVEGALTAEWRRQHPVTETAAALLARILAERRGRWEEAQLAKLKAAGKSPPKDWRAKYSEPTANDTTHLPMLPEGWCWVSLDQLSIFTTSGSRGWAEYYSQEGPLFVRSQDIRTDRLVLADVAHVMPPASSEGARTRLCRGDLLVTITGANVAKAAVVDCDLDEAYVSQHVGMTRLVFSDVGAFVHIYVTAPSGGRKKLLQAAYGAGKPGLNLDNLRELPISLPPLHEQAAIVDAVEDQLSVIEHLEDDLEAKLKSAQALRQSILRHAFTGQLVPQDPNDEPAIELLKRIAVEREERARQVRAAKQAKERPLTPRRRAATN